MKDRNAVLVAAMLIQGACTTAEVTTQSAGASRPGRPPNMVVVLVDDLRWDEIRALGHPFIETPNVDRLVREGAAFINAFATTPLCSPSRANFLTGQYAHANGIIDNTARPSHELSVFPIELQRAGYSTAFFGKWHMGNDDSPRPGFDHWVAQPGQGEALDPPLNVDGKHVEAKGYVTDILTDYVERYIEQTTDKPFLVYLAHKAIHPNIIQRDDGSTTTLSDQPGGFIAAERHRGRYVGRAMPRRRNAFVPPTDKLALLRPLGNLPPMGAKTATPNEDIRGRLEMLLAVDESLGRIVSALERRGALDDTVIVFTSDHGYYYGEHGLNEERRLAYEETIRIPLVVRHPQTVPASSTPAEMALSIDVAPTLLDLAGVVPGPAIQGRSLVPVLQHTARRWRSSFLIEYFTDTVFPRTRNMGYVAARTTRHKYIRYRELPGMDELYDVERDPFELNNLANRTDARPLLESMRRELRELLVETHFDAALAELATPTH